MVHDGSFIGIARCEEVERRGIVRYARVFVSDARA